MTPLTSRPVSKIIRSYYLNPAINARPLGKGARAQTFDQNTEE